MVNQNMKEWSEKIIAGRERIAIPIMSFSEVVGVSACILEKVVIVGMDLSVEAEAFGAEVMFSESGTPRVVGRLVSNSLEISALPLPRLDKGRIAVYIEASRNAAKGITDKPIFACCVGPFSLAGMLYGVPEIQKALSLEPEAIKLLLSKSTEFITYYAKALKAVGVNGVFLSDPLAGLLSNDLCQEFSSDFVKRIIEDVQDDNFMMVLHNCGNEGNCTAAMISVGAMAYHFGNAIDMIEALDASPKDVLIMGNIDPVAIMKQSTAAQVKEAVAILLERTKNYPNYVLSTGCDTPHGVPAENINAFYEALAEFNR